MKAHEGLQVADDGLDITLAVAVGKSSFGWEVFGVMSTPATLTKHWLITLSHHTTSGAKKDRSHDPGVLSLFGPVAHL